MAIVKRTSLTLTPEGTDLTVGDLEDFIQAIDGEIGPVYGGLTHSENDAAFEDFVRTVIRFQRVYTGDEPTEGKLQAVVVLPETRYQ